MEDFFIMDIESIITNLGFPIAVAAWALWQSKQHEEFLQGILTQTLKENTEATEKLARLVQKLLSIYEKGSNKEDIDEEGD